MIAEIGRFFLMLGFAFSVMSWIYVAALAALGLPPPDLLVRFAAIPRLITGGADLQALLNFAGTVATGVAGLALLNVLLRLLGFGGVSLTNVFQPQALALYLAIWVPFADGVSVVLRGLGWHMAMLYPGPLSGMVWAFFTAAEAVVKFMVIYYIATRVLGMPSE